MKVVSPDNLSYFAQKLKGKFATQKHSHTAAEIGAATEDYVDRKVTDLVNSAPETLNTLNELASALGDDPNFATTVLEELSKKVNKDDVAQPDLAQNDSTAPDYVKNRTHWEERNVVEIVPLQTLTKNYHEDGDGVADGIFLTEPLNLVPGETYVVSWNGIEHTCEAIDVSEMTNGMATAALSDEPNVESQPSAFVIFEISPEAATEIGYPVLISVYDGSETVEFAIHQEKHEVHQLDPKYIKDMYHVEEVIDEILPEMSYTTSEEMDMTFEVNLSAPITAGKTYEVNWNGTTYKCVAKPYEVDGVVVGNLVGNGDMVLGTGDSGEPFVAMSALPDYAAMINASHAFIALDGSTSGIVSMKGPKEVVRHIDPKYIKDMYFSEEGEETLVYFIDGYSSPQYGYSTDDKTGIPDIGDKCRVKWNKVDFELIAKECTVEDLKAVAVAQLGSIEENGFCVVFSDQTDGMTVHIRTAQEEWFTLSIYKDTTVVHHIDPKYIKDMYYSEGGSSGVILKELTLEIPEDDPMGGFNETLNLVPGDTYIVAWNGVEYQCVAQEMVSDGITAIVLGNQAMMGGESTGEPFIILYAPDALGGLMTTAVVAMDGSTSVKLGIVGAGEKIHHIDPKYIKDMYHTGEVENFFEEAVHVDVNGIGSVQRKIGLVEGREYVVTFNGKEYSTVARRGFLSIDSSIEVIGIGNLGNGTYAHKDGVNTGEPFSINEIVSAAITVFDLGGENEDIQIAMGTQKIYKIDPKYLPDKVTNDTINVIKPGARGIDVNKVVDIVYENKRFVAIEYETLQTPFTIKVKTSADGVTWNETFAIEDFDLNSGVMFNGKHFMFLCSKAKELIPYVSEDGSVWRPVFSVPLSDDKVWHMSEIAVGVANGRFVVLLGNNSNVGFIYDANDPEVRVDFTLPVKCSFDHRKNRSLSEAKIFYQNGRYIADPTLTSEDGINWVSSTNEDIVNGGFIDIVCVNNQLIDWQGRRSSNGKDWTLPTYGKELNGNGRDIYHVGDKIIVISDGRIPYGQSSNDKTYRLLVSEDGTTWDIVDNPSESKWTSIQALGYGNGRFILLITNDYNTYLSYDARNWSSKLVYSSADKDVTPELIGLFPRANFNENDPLKPSHIYNRPFVEEEVLMFRNWSRSGTKFLTVDEVTGFYYTTGSDYTNGKQKLVEGKEYKIECVLANNEYYECMCVCYYDKATGSYILGNKAKLEGFGDTGEPFAMVISKYANAGDHYQCVTTVYSVAGSDRIALGVYNNVVTKKLDPKFLPDEVANHIEQNALVIQTCKALSEGSKGALVFGNGVFLKDDDDSISRSEDLINWEKVRTTIAYPGKLKYLNGQFIVLNTLSSDVKEIACSDRGQMWKRYERDIEMYIQRDITYGNGKYVLVGGAAVQKSKPIVMVSDDLQNWTVAMSGERMYADSLRFYCGKFFIRVRTYIEAESNYSSKYYYSEDGISWTEDPMVYLGVYGNGKVLYKFEKSVEGVKGSYIYRSDDGINWNVDEIRLPQYTLDEILFCEDRFFVPYTGGIMYSFDGEDWQVIEDSKLSNINGICHDGEKFVATISSSKKLMISYDGIKWHDEMLFNAGNDVTKKLANLLPKPDMDQNDPTQPDYIQNRPFYDEEAYFMEEQEVTFAAIEGLGGIVGSMVAMDVPPIYGDTYTVSYNGVDYECVYQNGGIGNMGAMGAEGVDDTGEPFAIVGALLGSWILLPVSQKAETASVSIKGLKPVPMKERYIPESFVLDLTSLGYPTVTEAQQGMNIDVDYLYRFEEALRLGRIKVKFNATFNVYTDELFEINTNICKNNNRYFISAMLPSGYFVEISMDTDTSHLVTIIQKLTVS